MRISLFIALLGIFTACGNPPTDSPGNSDSIVDSVAHRADSSAFLEVRSAVSHIDIPVLVWDSLNDDSGFSRYRLDESDCKHLFPADFDFAMYKSVSCFGESTIGKIPMLWFELHSKGADEKSGDIIDFILVMYDDDSLPIDACNVKSSDIGYSSSYVREDSVFTVFTEVIENINITTTELAISESGFVPAASEMHTFDSGNAGKQKSIDFKNAYFSKRGVTLTWIQ